MSEPNKDGTDMMMALLAGLSCPRASRAWTEAQEIQAMSFLTLAEHWINETATEIVRVNEENARLKAEVERLKMEESKLLTLCETYEGDLERLRKAGDKLVEVIQEMDVIIDMDSDHPEVKAWNAAKEGKQP